VGKKASILVKALAAISIIISLSGMADAGLQARFIGVTTILLDDGETAIMTDGFFSRPGLGEAFFRITPNETRIEDGLKRLEVRELAAVLTAHSHHDHAMDAPSVAARTGAVLIGSESTANIARGADFPDDRIRRIKGGETFTFGRFTITAIKSPHTPSGFFMGEIVAPLKPSAWIWDYQEGGSFSFLIEHDGKRILINPSTNFLPGLLQGRKVDVVFLGVATLGKLGEAFAQDYWREVVEATGATRVIPIHWDNFFAPLTEPLAPFPWPVDDFDKTKDMLRALAAKHGVTLQFMGSFETIDLDAVPVND